MQSYGIDGIVWASTTIKQGGITRYYKQYKI